MLRKRIVLAGGYVAVLLALGGCSAPFGAAGADSERQRRDGAAAQGVEYGREIERQSPSDPPTDFTDAKLGTPVPVAHVGLDALRAYRAGDDPRTLVASDEDRAYLYPVLVDDQVRSSVVVRRHGDEWKPEVFGQAHRASQVYAIHRQLEAGNAAIGVTLVEVPGIPAEFLSHDEDADLFLTPLQDVPGTALVRGTTVPAADAFTQLQVVAATKPGR